MAQLLTSQVIPCVCGNLNISQPNFFLFYSKLLFTLLHPI